MLLPHNLGRGPSQEMLYLAPGIEAILHVALQVAVYQSHRIQAQADGFHILDRSALTAYRAPALQVRLIAALCYA